MSPWKITPAVSEQDGKFPDFVRRLLPSTAAVLPCIHWEQLAPQVWETLELRGPNIRVFEEVYQTALAMCEQRGDAELAIEFFDVSLAVFCRLRLLWQDSTTVAGLPRVTGASLCCRWSCRIPPTLLRYLLWLSTWRF